MDGGGGRGGGGGGDGKRKPLTASSIGNIWDRPVQCSPWTSNASKELCRRASCATDQRRLAGSLRWPPGEHALLTALVLFPSRGVMQCCQVFQRTKLRIFDCAPSNRGAMGCASSSPAEPAEAENNSKSCGINALDALGKPMAAQEQWDPDGSMEQGDHFMARRAAHAGPAGRRRPCSLRRAGSSCR